MGRHKKIKDIKQTDGQQWDRPAQRKGNFDSLDELFGFNQSKYKTNKPEEYLEWLSSLAKVDMQNECVRVGVMPNDNQGVMKDRLLRQFQATTAVLLKTGVGQPITLKVSEKARKVLAEGANRLA